MHIWNSFFDFPFRVFDIYKLYGAHIANPNGATDYSWEPGQLLTTVLEGFAFLRMDSNGFNNMEVTPKQETDILLMGKFACRGGTALGR